MCGGPGAGQPLHRHRCSAAGHGGYAHHRREPAGEKGYLERRRDDRDKRAVRLYPTEKARVAEERHARFHAEMVDHILEALTPGEREVFRTALGHVAELFRQKESHGINPFPL